LAGGVPKQGVVVEGVRGVEYAPIRPECTKTVKNGWFRALFGLKIAENENELYLFKVSEVIYAPSHLD
jgi:hypothetical protein